MSVPRDGMDGEFNNEDGPIDDEITMADRQDVEPPHGADYVADAARAGNARNTTPSIRNNSVTPHQTNMDVHDEDAMTTVVSSTEGSNTTQVNVMRDVNRVRLPIASDDDEDSYSFTAATSSSGISRSTTLYVIYEVEQENGVPRSEDEQWSEGEDADGFSATAASSSTEVHQTAMWKQEVTSVQRSVMALTAGQSTIITVSPHRKDLRDDIREQQLATEEGEIQPIFKFSKRLLIWMDHDKTHLEIDLFRPKDLRDIYPTHVLSPLCLYRKLQSLKIVGMMQSYQTYIWLVVWLNPCLSELTLETSCEGEAMDGAEILKARDYAKCKPTMSEIAQGYTGTTISKEFPITKLSLSNFVLDGSFFGWFDRKRLLEVEIRRCKISNDLLSGDGIFGLTDTKVTIIP